MTDRTRQASQQLDPSRPFDGLTYKQFAYCQARASGLDMSAAYRSAYDCETSTPESIGRMAYGIEQDLRVVAKIRQLTDERFPSASLVPIITRDSVLQGIANIALQGEKESNRLRAFELLGKTIGIDLFRAPDQLPEKPRTIDDIDQELKQALTRLKPVIEGQARPVDVAPARPPDRRRKPKA